jgi:hypothetical protein
VRCHEAKGHGRGFAGIGKLPNWSSLPQKFFDGHVSEVVFLVRDFYDEFIDLCGVVVHGTGWWV